MTNTNPLNNLYMAYEGVRAVLQIFHVMCFFCYGGIKNAGPPSKLQTHNLWQQSYTRVLSPPKTWCQTENTTFSTPWMDPLTPSKTLLVPPAAMVHTFPRPATVSTRGQTAPPLPTSKTTTSRGNPRPLAFSQIGREVDKKRLVALKTYRRGRGKDASALAKRRARSRYITRSRAPPGAGWEMVKSSHHARQRR